MSGIGRASIASTISWTANRWRVWFDRTKEYSARNHGKTIMPGPVRDDGDRGSLAAALLGAPVAGADSRAGRSHRSEDRGDSRQGSRGERIRGSRRHRCACAKTSRPAGQARSRLPLGRSQMRDSIRDDQLSLKAFYRVAYRVAWHPSRAERFSMIADRSYSTAESSCGLRRFRRERESCASLPHPQCVNRQRTPDPAPFRGIGG
jgi:hypothetical protein